MMDILSEVSRLADEHFSEKEKFVPGISNVPASGPLLDSGDIVELQKALLKFWYTEGRYCSLFAGRLSNLIRSSSLPILCNSGSSATLLSMAALESRSKKYVITCASSFPTTVSAIYHSGRIPIYIDIDPYSLCPDVSGIDYAIEDHGHDIAAAILTHTLGFPFDEKEVSNILYEKNIEFVADCCDALGAELSPGIPVGFYSTMSTYSFFPAHQICAIEGGAVAFRDESYKEKLRSLSEWGRSCRCKPGQSNVCGKRFCYPYENGDLPSDWDHKYAFTEVGYNLKITEFQAALGYSQLSKLGDFTHQRILNWNYLWNEIAANYSEFILTTSPKPGVKPSPFGFPIVLSTHCPFSRKDLVQYLEKANIKTRMLFAGNIVRQPAYSQLEYIKIGNLPGSNLLMDNAFWIGCHPALTIEMLSYVVDTFHKFFREMGLK